MNPTFDLVKLIEKSPVTRLSNTHQHKFLDKLKSSFTESAQQSFLAHFYCYLNYDKTDFVVDLDFFWRWMGFSRKDPAKRLLETQFVVDIDYKVFHSKVGSSKGGRPIEKMMLTINAFKKFCLKAGTTKADEIHNYYIKLEELLYETINEECEELREQLTQKDTQLTRRITNFRKGFSVYIGYHEIDKEVFKVGITEDPNQRSMGLSGSTSSDFIITKVWYTNFAKLVEDAVKKNYAHVRYSLTKELYYKHAYDDIFAYVNKLCTVFNDTETQAHKSTVSGSTESVSPPEPVVESCDEAYKSESVPPPEPVVAKMESCDEAYDSEDDIITVSTKSNYQRPSTSGGVFDKAPKKKCSKCKLVSTLRNFYLRINSDPAGYDEAKEYTDKALVELKSRYRSQCKKCCNDKGKALKAKLKASPNFGKTECETCSQLLEDALFYKAKPGEEKIKQCMECYNSSNDLVDTKQCDTCFAIKSMTEFHKHSGEQLRPKCKDCRNSDFRTKRAADAKICPYCSKTIINHSTFARHQKTIYCLKARGIVVEKKTRKVSLCNIRSKQIVQYTVADNKLVKEYLSIHQAEKETGVRRNGIDRCVRNKAKTAGGFIWKYKESPAEQPSQN